MSVGHSLRYQLRWLLKILQTQKGQAKPGAASHSAVCSLSGEQSSWGRCVLTCPELGREGPQAGAATLGLMVTPDGHRGA